MRCWSGSKAAAAVLSASLLLACGAEPAPSNAVDGDAAVALAPDFTLPDLDRQSVSLASFRGRLVVIDFWATWCAPCVYQIPVLNGFFEAHRDDGVMVLGIAVDAEGWEVVAPFAAEQGIRYPVLLGSEALAWRYGAPGFPALAIVDAEGRIDSVHVGVIDREELEAAVARLRASGAAAVPEEPA